jgi:hypothetical protein
VGKLDQSALTSVHNTPCTAGEFTVTDLDSWDIERRADGALLVRVHSRSANGWTLPDAVFAFRAGDPQYQYWERQLHNRQFGSR